MFNAIIVAPGRSSHLYPGTSQHQSLTEIRVMLDNDSQRSKQNQEQVRKKKHPVGYWTKERIIEETKKYKSKTEFRESKSANFFAHRDFPGLLDEIYGNLIKPSNYWNRETITLEAKKFTNRKIFQTKCKGASEASYRYPGLLDSIFGNKKMLWTKENIIKESKKYSTKVEFRRKNISAYSAALKLNGLIDELFVNQRIAWDERKILEVASRYSKISDFQRAYGSAYYLARTKYPFILKDLFFPHKDYYRSDSVYLWNITNTNVYKIGTTTFIYRNRRINRVAKCAGVTDFSVIRFVKVKNALSVEKELLKIGAVFNFEAMFDGATEFRQLNSDELNQVISIIDSHVLQTDQSIATESSHR